MPTRGRFIVPGSKDVVFDVLVKTCKEMKAKITKIDNVGYNIEGKSATSFSKWGAKFNIKVLAIPSDVIVEIQNLSRLPDDRFIKDFYSKFSQHAKSVSSLTIENMFPGLGHVSSLVMSATIK